jgi:hypothetical protein
MFGGILIMPESCPRPWRGKAAYSGADWHIIYCGLQQNMNVLLAQTISAWGWLTLLAARNSEGDDTIWVNMLVIVILAVAFGIFSLAKAKANKSKVEDLPRPKREHTGKTFNSRKEWLSPLSGPARAKSEDLHKKREKDLQSGMELLEMDFLLNIVENTNDGSDEKDVVIRKLNFKELLRRGKLNQTDSKALRVYAINKGNLYGKDIQCEAMKSLAERTAKGNKQ